MNDYILEPSRYLPDPDAVEVTIGCRQDTEAEVCPYCHGTGREPMSDNLNWLPCPDCHGTGVKA